MYVELIYDEGPFEGIPNAKNTIQAELERRIHRFLPGTEVRVKAATGISAVNTGFNNHQKAMIVSLIQDMFNEADMWLVNEV